MLRLPIFVPLSLLFLKSIDNFLIVWYNKLPKIKLGRLLHYEYSLFDLILYKQNMIISAAGSE